MRERGAYIYIIYLFININIYVENARSEERRGGEGVVEIMRMERGASLEAPPPFPTFDQL